MERHVTHIGIDFLRVILPFVRLGIGKGLQSGWGCLNSFDEIRVLFEPALSQARSILRPGRQDRSVGGLIGKRDAGLGAPVAILGIGGIVERVRDVRAGG